MEKFFTPLPLPRKSAILQTIPTPCTTSPEVTYALRVG